MTYKFEVRFDVADLTPNHLSSRDVAELISSVESMLEAIILRDNPTLKLQTGTVIASLIAVKSGSSTYEMASELDDVVRPAHQKASAAIANRTFDMLPSKSVDAIREIKKIAKKYNAPLEFTELNGTRRVVAVVTPTMEIDTAEAGFIAGQTTLYGFLTGVTGENPPRARMRLLDGTTFDCHVTEKDNLRVARELGTRLYTEIGVYGTARWELTDELILDHFLIEEVSAFTPVPVDKALDSLHKIAGEDYSKVDDIESLINQLRGRDEDTE